ncbi:MAG: cell wall metabolism sensor histidine kinase WalK [Firmicutes bacterium]|nr:cell wall metabolism sensor histidine kinase WalK [Bacillota bacterium]
MKFRTRLFLFYLGAVTLITVFLAAYFINIEEKRVWQTLYEQLSINAKLIAGRLAGETLLDRPDRIAGLTAKLARQTGLRITVIDVEGTVLADSAHDAATMPNHKERPEFRLALQGKEGFINRYSQTLKEYLIYVAYPVKVQDKITGAVRVAKSQNELVLSLARIRWLIIGGIGLTTLLAVLLGFILVFQIAKPLMELKRLATRISQGDLRARVRFFGHDELADLGLTFNLMAERLTESFAVIEDEKAKLQVILANLNDGILVIDRHLRIILANPAAQTLLGLDPTNIAGRPVMEAVLNHHLLDLIEEVNRVRSAFERELVLHHPHSKQLQVLLAPLKDETGVVTGSIVVLHDLTRLRRLERVRQDFVANVSHELRTPITAIKGMAETLLRGGRREPEMLLRYLRAIDQESDRMAALINDLLALARLDAKTEMPVEPFDLADLISEVQERFVAANTTVPLFSVDLPPQPLPRVKANRDQIRQVLINLLDNAFKFTPRGGKITLSVVSRAGAREEEGPGEAGQPKGFLTVAVKDTGIGIPPEELDRIFERFYRVDKARSREQGGTGLGLSIVKHIVESYGGKVEVESVPGQGSVFRFTVPIISS